jgi:hypothetical protein
MRHPGRGIRPHGHPLAYRQGRGPFVYRFEPSYGSPCEPGPLSFVTELKGALGDEHVVTEPEQLARLRVRRAHGPPRRPRARRPPGSTEESRRCSRVSSRARAVRRARRGHRPVRGATPVAGASSSRSRG